MDGAEEAATQANNGATNNNLNNSNNLNNTTDNEATNCSETMSTNDEDYNLENLEQTGGSDQYQALIDTTTSSVKNRISTPRRVLQLQAEPHLGNCDSNYNQTNDRASFMQQQGVIQAESSNNQDYETTETNTPSLASACHAPPSYGTATRGDNNFATLDAEQLNNVLGNCSIILADQKQQQHRQLSPRMATTCANNDDNQQQRQGNYILAGQLLLNANPTGSLLANAGQERSGNEEQANSKSASLFRNTHGDISNKTIGISRTMESSARLSFDEQQRQEYQRQQQLKQQRELQSRPYPFFKLVNNGINARQKETQQQQRQRPHERTLVSYGQGTSQLSAYLTSSASLPRIHLAAHSNGQQPSVASSIGSIAGQASANSAMLQAAAAAQNQAANFGKINLGLDNNQASSSRWQQRCQQQQQHQMVARKMFARDLINHVISARESMQWKPQTNQYYATSFNSARTLPAGSRNFATGAKSMLEPAARVSEIQATREHNQQQQQQQQLGIIDAAFNVSAISHNSPHWPFNGTSSVATGNHNEQAAGSTAPFNTSSSLNTSATFNQLSVASSSRFPRSISNVLGEGTAAVAPSDIGAHLLLLEPDSSGKQASQEQQQRIYGSKRAAMMAAQQLRRSDEDLNTSSRKHRDQQAAQHRKRRRHRSTSGRSLSPAESGKQTISNVDTNNATNSSALAQLNSNAQMLEQFSSETGNNASAKSNQQQQQHKTISAHCWLIDSSDDQAEVGRKGLRQSTQKSERIDPQQPAHLTVAMMRQSEQHAQMRMMAEKQQQQQSVMKRIEHNKPFSSTTNILLDQVGQPTRKTHDKDLTSNLKTNSLKLERILSRNNCNNNNTTANANNNNQAARLNLLRMKQPVSANTSSYKKENSSDKRAKSGKVLRRMRRSLSASSNSSVSISPESSGSSNGSSCVAARSPRHTYHANAVVRLSALLSMISNLVKRGPKCLKMDSIYSSSTVQNDLRNHPKHSHCLAPTNSISGSVSAPSVGLAAPYTAASLAISSSSSTSAYATGSSHLSSNLSNPSARILAPTNVRGQSHRANKPIGLAHFKTPPSNASTAGSSLFYSSSGASALQNGQSSHGYEYCDTDIQFDETKFNQKTDIIQMQQTCTPTTSGHFTSGLEMDVPAGRDNPSPANSNLASLERSSTASSGSQGRRALQQAAAAADKELRHIILSDNELISAGSDLNNNDANVAATATAAAAAAGFNILRSSAVLPTSLVQNASHSSAARRRWWWNSLKDWFRRPCKAGNSDCSINLNQDQCCNQSAAARYKSLRNNSKKRSTKANQMNRNGSSSSMIQNVMSLAKADRVFRIRLIASIIVSCILLGLLLTLVTMLYWRSNHSSLSSLYQNNRLNFLIDDSDYDLSWLWTKNITTPLNGAKFSRPIVPNTQKTAPFTYQANNNDGVKTLAEQQIDNSLKAQIIMIEQSERLNQQHETITFLTNIQLANDNFIDISQVSEQLYLKRFENNLNRSEILSQSNNHSKLDRNNSRLVYLSDLERDLVSMTLLSNLHWPLVKWRHQNQRSVANFLSFSISPSLFGGSQTLKNFLSLLILAETMGDHSPPIIVRNNLNQFLRLYSLLKNASNHLIHCSQLMQNDRFLKLDSLKGKFCQQLVNGYKRMMLVLSQLDHNHLNKFNNPLEQSPLISSFQEQQFKHTSAVSSSRTLLGFFLDRLALLDVENVAEATLAMNSEDLDNSNLIRLMNQLINIKQISKKSPNYTNNDRSKSSLTLIELTKLVIGESPMNLNLNLEKNQEFRQRFQQLEADNGDAWREMLAQDLLYPWPSSKLSKFVIPNNYDLFFHPNLTTRFISGMLKIEFRVERVTRFIVINCGDLNIVDLSLMLKQSNYRSNIEHPTFQRQNQNYSNTLKPIIVRRILLNAKLEQLYIELYDPIQPFPLDGSVSTNQQDTLLIAEQQEQARAINFGDLPIYNNNNNKNNNFNSDKYNNYLINISFNKTNLMSSEHFKDSSGLKFIQYGDYFTQPEAEVKTILYTQFEPINARKVFPCFDEPQLKAKVQLNLVHEQNYQVLFNAPKREKIPFSSDGLIQMSVFESTPIPISTYLISFIVCDLQNIKSITSRVPQLQIDSRGFIRPPIQFGDQQKYIQVQILANFEHLSQAEYSSQLVPQLLAFYQNYLQFPYPSDKLDLIALPKRSAFEQQQETNVIGNANSPNSASFQIDTMENLGLIWFKEPLLLIDTNLISQNLIEQVSMIISHQIAHQYFGNIVTISQWPDLWLYEALCQYLESIALSSVQIDWKLEEQFVVTTIQETLTSEQFDTHLDYTSSSSPLSDGPTFGGNEVPISMPTVPLDLLVSPSNAEQEQKQAYVDQALSSALPSSSSSATSLPLNIKNSSDLEPDLQALEGGQDNVDNTNNLLGPWQFADRFAKATESSLFNSIEFRRSSAILHMLLFNLFPSSESQARLLRRCLDIYRYKTMSQAQFWRLFGEQLAQEASLDRLSLDLSKFSSQNNKVFEQQPESSLDSPLKNKTFGLVNQEQNASERVVFVRPAPKQQHHISEEEDIDQFSGPDIHKIRSRSSRLVDNLDLVVNYWLDQHNYPLITASAYRDKLHLRQERFSFAWWDETSSNNGADVPTSDDTVHAKWTNSEHIEILLPSANPNPSLVKRSPSSVDNQNVPEHSQDQIIWPVPLMFVSRFNPKQAQFFWMDKREMRVPFGDHLSSSSLSPDSSDSSDSSVNSRSDYSSLPELRSLSRGYSNSWFKLNVNQSSLVRINYDERNWEALTELLVKSHYSNHLLSSLDRANLIDDAFTLMRCGKLSVGIAMNLTLYLEVGEREFMPWTSALKHLDQMQTLLNQNPLWHRYVLKLMQPISSVIGWKDDGPHLMRKMRRNLFSVALQYGDDKIVNKAKGDFKSWFKNNRFIVPNLQELVYVAGVLYGDQQEWFHCWQKYQQLVSLDSIEQDLNSNADLNSQSANQTTTNNVKSSIDHALRDQRQLQATLISGMLPTSIIGSSEYNEVNIENEKRQLLTALASTHNTWLLEQFLNYSIDSTKIQPHHLKHVMQTLGKYPVARLYLWRFVRLNWATLVDKYMPKPNEPYNTNKKKLRGSTSDYQQVLETMIVESTKHFATKLDYDEVKAFFEEKQKQRSTNPYLTSWSPSVERAIQHSLQIIKSNIYWRNFIEPKLTKWLSHFDNTIIN